MWPMVSIKRRSKVHGIVDETGRLYKPENRTNGTHLALRWNGRLRFCVPNERAAQESCWNVFRPGSLAIPLRAMARLSRLFGTTSCVEAEDLIIVREMLGREAGLSCCRTGAEGVWSKDTVLFLDRKSRPLYIVKVGVGTAVDTLLENESYWLQNLRNQTQLVNHIPELVTHFRGTAISFVAQCAITGDLDFRLGTAQLDFLRKLQESSLQCIQYQYSILYRTINLRVKDLRGLLSEAWSMRLERALRQIDDSCSNSPLQLVTAHNDFTPWNIRVKLDLASVFDWEYAADQQFPLFDPLHFVLMPMALKRESTGNMIRKMNSTVQLCGQWFGSVRCHKAETQALAYFVNLCTLYLWSMRGASESHPTLESYARLIDYLCRAPV